MNKAWRDNEALKRSLRGLFVVAFLVSAAALLEGALQAQSELVLAQEEALGQFPAQSESERELAKMLTGKDADTNPTDPRIDLENLRGVNLRQ